LLLEELLDTFRILFELFSIGSLTSDFEPLQDINAKEIKTKVCK
jgi:hypothetical protein